MKNFLINGMPEAGMFALSGKFTPKLSGLNKVKKRFT